MQPKILLVEDNDTLGYILKEYLEMKDFSVIWAINGRKGWKAFDKQKFDLCILDIMMPEMGGFTLAQKIKAVNEDIPLIFLTAKSLKIDKLKGFDIGADDYIVKPIDEEELVARIKAVLRRSIKKAPVETDYKIGQYLFDVTNQRLIFEGQAQYLTEMETQLLGMLCEKQGNLVSREYMLKEIWGKSDYFTRRSMDVFISRLRKYLGGDKQVKISNVHGSGFVLNTLAN